MDVNKFSERAREAIETAQGVVRRGSGNVLGTEHLLIGVLSLPGGVVEQILNVLGIDKGALMTRADQMAQNQPVGTSGPSGPAEMLYMTPRAKAAIDLAVQEAQKLGDEFVGTEHLLLGIFLEGEGPGSAILRDVGVTEERLRQGTAQALLGHPDISQYGAARPLALEEDAQQQVLGTDELVAELLRLLHGEVDGRLGAGGHVEHLRWAGRTAGADRLVLGHLVGARHQRALVDAEHVEDLLDHSARQAEHADEQVFGAEHVAGASADHALRGLDGLAGAFGELVHIHGLPCLTSASLTEDTVLGGRAAPFGSGPPPAPAQRDHLRAAGGDEVEAVRALHALDLAPHELGRRVEARVQPFQLGRHGAHPRLHGQHPLHAGQVEAEFGELLERLQRIQQPTELGLHPAGVERVLAMEARMSSMASTRSTPARLRPSSVSCWMRCKRSTSRGE